MSTSVRESHKQRAYREWTRRRFDRQPGEPPAPIIPPLRPQYRGMQRCEECWEAVPFVFGWPKWLARRIWRRICRKHQEEWGHDPAVDFTPESRP